MKRYSVTEVELKRYKVLMDVEEGRINLKAASEMLGEMVYANTPQAKGRPDTRKRKKKNWKPPENHLWRKYGQLKSKYVTF